MVNQPNETPGAAQPATYRIRVRGHLDHGWTEWLEGMTLTLEDDGTTLLTTPIVDQAALHGLLRRVRDLGIPLLSVAGDEAGATDLADTGT